MYAIPVIDLRNSDPVTLLSEYKERAEGLIASSRESYGIIGKALTYPLLPVTDALVRKWLQKSNNPFYQEIRQFAAILKQSGVYTLNLSYEFGCTTGVFRTTQGLTLLRVLDWPLPELGKNVMLLHQKGEAGDYQNASWAGLSGTFNAQAKGRFSAAINLAPMRRHYTNILLDYLYNRYLMFQSSHIPPAHLLRQVFETAKDYDQAKQMLVETPLCVPVIFTLCGIKANEGCVIERLETQAVIHEISEKNSVMTANHFQSHFNGTGLGWMPRPIDSAGRMSCMQNLEAALISDSDMDWFIAPIANERTCLVFVSNPESGRLMLQGFNGVTPTTQLLRH